jgi:hypothetical protein
LAHMVLRVQTPNLNLRIRFNLHRIRNPDMKIQKYQSHRCPSKQRSAQKKSNVCSVQEIELRKISTILDRKASCFIDILVRKFKELKLARSPGSYLIRIRSYEWFLQKKRIRF